ncbi:hypothetical protein MPSEU_000839900 [Mayamaea pseudoterrestris]|nr:hypothetical protein MPSEU_000839900 [Mayamaea pseudoterrestris]
MTMTKSNTNETMESVILSSSYGPRRGALDALLQNDSEELKSWGRSDESCHTASTILSYEDLSDCTESHDIIKETTLVRQEHPARRVQFSNVETREFNLTIGDHPIAESYPLSLDWDYLTVPNVPIDQYKTRSCNRLNAMARKIRIALVSGHSLQDLSMQEAKRMAVLNEAEIREWLNYGEDQDSSSLFSLPIKSSAILYTMSDHCDDMDVSLHSERSSMSFMSFDDDDDSLLDFDEDDEFFEGF